jgi:hypothetical protein
MRLIIGLFREKDELTRSTQRLEEAGFLTDKIDVLTDENAIRKLLGCKPTCVVTNYAIWGASIGIAVYATSGLLAGLCQCNLFHFGVGLGFGTFLGGILAGAFIGGVLGCLIGAAEYEKDSHLYVQGARMGGKVMVVRVSEDETESVKYLLQQEKASGVKVLPRIG